MLFPFGLFLVLVIWAAKDGELYVKEGLIYGAIFLLCLIGMLALPGIGLYFVVPMVLLDVYLIVKLLGNPTV